MTYANTTPLPPAFRPYGRNVYQLASCIAKSNDSRRIDELFKQLVLFLKRRKELEEVPATTILSDLYGVVGGADRTLEHFQKPSVPIKSNYRRSPLKFRCCGAHLTDYIKEVYPLLSTGKGGAPLLLALLKLIHHAHKGGTPAELYHHLQQIGDKKLGPLPHGLENCLPLEQEKKRLPFAPKRVRGFSKRPPRNG